MSREALVYLEKFVVSPSIQLCSRRSLLPDDESDIDGRIDLERGDVINDGRWAVDIDNSLVDSHLVSVPGVSSLSAWGLSNGNSQDLGWDSNWALGLVSLVLSTRDDLAAGPLKWLNFSSLKSDSKR